MIYHPHLEILFFHADFLSCLDRRVLLEWLLNTWIWQIALFSPRPLTYIRYNKHDAVKMFNKGSCETDCKIEVRNEFGMSGLLDCHLMNYYSQNVGEDVPGSLLCQLKLKTQNFPNQWWMLTISHAANYFLILVKVSEYSNPVSFPRLTSLNRWSTSLDDPLPHFKHPLKNLNAWHKVLEKLVSPIYIWKRGCSVETLL